MSYKWNEKQSLVGEFSPECFECPQRLYCTAAASNVGSLVLELLSCQKINSYFIPSHGLFFKFYDWDDSRPRSFFIDGARDVMRNHEFDPHKIDSIVHKMTEGFVIKIGLRECMGMDDLANAFDQLYDNRISFLVHAEAVRGMVDRFFGGHPYVCRYNTSLICAMGYLAGDLSSNLSSVNVTKSLIKKSKFNVTSLTGDIVNDIVKTTEIKSSHKALSNEIFNLFYRPQDSF